MKAKNLLRIVALAFVMCLALAAVCSAQELDAKILRFDGLGNVHFTADFNQRNTSGAYPKGRIEYTGEGTARFYGYNNGTLETKTYEPMFTIDPEETFYINDYPYIKIKYKTNYGGKLQFYVTNQNLFYCTMNREAYPSWIVAEMEMPLNDTEKTSTTGPDGYSWTVGSAGGKVPDDSNKMEVINPFFQMKEIYSGGVEALHGEDPYLEIEYIAFFKNTRDMVRFDSDRPSLIFGYNGDGNARSGVSGAEYTVDNTLHYQFAESASVVTEWINFNFSYVEDFSLYDYPFMKLRFKTDFPGNLQHYIVAPDGSYYLTWLDKNGTHNGNFGSEDLGKPYTIEIGYPTDGSSVAHTYTDSFGHSWVTSPGSPFPTADNPVYLNIEKTGSLNTVFMQVKDIPVPASGYYFDLDYIAYFQTEEDMLAFDSDAGEKLAEAVQTVMPDLNAYTFKVHPACTGDDIANYVQSQVEGKVSDMTVTAVAEDYTPGDETCKVIVTIAGEYSSKELGFEVALENLPGFETETLGAQMRTQGVQGLRFGTKIYDFNASSYDKVEYGTLVVPTAILENSGKSELTHEVTDALDVLAVNIFEQGEGYKVYTAVVTGIPDDGWELTARPYVKYTLDGKDYYVYGEAVSRSVNQVKDLSGWIK